MVARGILLSILLVSIVWADEQINIVNQHQLSKRPYAASVVDKKVIEESAKITEQVVVDKKHEPLRLHMLGRRPYMEKAAD